ncbi:MAG TPA: hypothetical protein VMT57_05665 [Candidatus Thermoplasmatota archaeon]|nr:hypothetical protein [Candidatus Thermoplasmatota archaeon]
MRKLNQQNIRWIIEQIDKQELSTYKYDSYSSIVSVTPMARPSNQKLSGP